MPPGGPRRRMVVIGLPARLVRLGHGLWRRRFAGLVALALSVAAWAVASRTGGEGLCGWPGAAAAPRSGPVYEDGLPWARRPSPELVALQEATGAVRLVGAFMVSFPDPLFEETENVAVAAGYLAGTVLQPGRVMSLNAVLGPYTSGRGYRQGPSYAGGRLVPSTGGGVCKVSTALYNAAVMAGVTVVERHPHSMPVPYVPPGRDAAVAWGYKDLRLRVDGDAPVVVWAAAEGNTVYVALYGSYDPPRVEWHQEELARTPFPTIRRPNPGLAAGQERVVIEGIDGVTVRTAVTVAYPGRTPERRELGTDQYRPLPRIVEYGPGG